MPSQDLEAHMRQVLLTGLVQKEIFCPNTGEVLDVRTCVVLVDKDGDPAYVLSQKGWANVSADPLKVAFLGQNGLTVDPSTVEELA